MLLIHKNEQELAKKLKGSKVLMVGVKKLSFDAKVPILSLTALEKWKREKKSLKFKIKLKQRSVETIPSPQLSPPKPPTPPKSAELIIETPLPPQPPTPTTPPPPSTPPRLQRHEPNKSTKNKPPEIKPTEIKPNENKPIENKPIENKPIENIPIENRPTENRPSPVNNPTQNKPLNESCFFVISEPIDDEFKEDYNLDYDEVDINPTITKNLRKIGHVLSPKKSNTDNIQNSHVEKRPKLLRDYIQQPNQCHKTDQNKQKSETPVKQVQLKEPDWPATLKLLESNNYLEVYLKLDQFKDRIASDAIAKNLTRDFLFKLLVADETKLLVNVLPLIFNLDFSEDSEFWTELVGRLKRKCSTPVTGFKNKMNPEKVLEDFKEMCKSVLKHFQEQIPNIKIPFLLSNFLIKMGEGPRLDTIVKVEKFESMNKFNLLPSSMLPVHMKEEKEDNIETRTDKIRKSFAKPPVSNSTRIVVIEQQKGDPNRSQKPLRIMRRKVTTG